MMKQLKDAMLFGIGLVSLSKDKVEEAVKKLSKEFEGSEKEGKEKVQEFLKEAHEAKEKFETAVQKAVQENLEKIKFATASEMDKLAKRIEELEKKLNDRGQ